MQSLMSFFAAAPRAGDPGTDVAGTLLERADACAGRDPHGAAQLRGAAITYLGVVR